MTSTWSASAIVLRRWAMTKLVRPFISFSSALCIRASVRVSTLLVASSKIKNRRISEDRARNCDQLALPLAQVMGPFGQLRRVAPRK